MRFEFGDFPVPVYGKVRKRMPLLAIPVKDGFRLRLRYAFVRPR